VEASTAEVEEEDEEEEEVEGSLMEDKKRMGSADVGSSLRLLSPLLLPSDAPLSLQ
jgi:hypothetical protein